MIVRAYCDEVGLDRGGAVKNEGSRVLNFTHRSDGENVSRHQGAAAFNGLVPGIYQGLPELVVALQIDRPSHERRLEHA